MFLSKHVQHRSSPPKKTYHIYLKLTHLPRLKEKWIQFDGVSYIYDEKSWSKKLTRRLRSTETVENRKKSLQKFMPKWKGFLVDQDDVEEEMTAVEALEKLDKVVSCLTEVWVKEYRDASPKIKEPRDFNIKTVSACKYT